MHDPLIGSHAAARRPIRHAGAVKCQASKAQKAAAGAAASLPALLAASPAFALVSVLVMWVGERGLGTPLLSIPTRGRRQDHVPHPQELLTALVAKQPGWRVGMGLLNAG